MKPYNADDHHTVQNDSDIHNRFNFRVETKNEICNGRIVCQYFVDLSLKTNERKIYVI